MLRPLRRQQRTAAIRVIAAYRTVSFDAAILLAKMPLWTLEASMRCRISEHKRDNTFDRKVDSEIRRGDTLLLVRQWDIFFGRLDAWGKRTTTAIKPYLRYH